MRCSCAFSPLQGCQSIRPACRNEGHQNQIFCAPKFPINLLLSSLLRFAIQYLPGQSQSKVRPTCVFQILHLASSLRSFAGNTKRGIRSNCFATLLAEWARLTISSWPDLGCILDLLGEKYFGGFGFMADAAFTRYGAPINSASIGPVSAWLIVPPMSVTLKHWASETLCEPVGVLCSNCI